MQWNVLHLRCSLRINTISVLRPLCSMMAVLVKPHCICWFYSTIFWLRAVPPSPHPHPHKKKKKKKSTARRLPCHFIFLFQMLSLPAKLKIYPLYFGCCCKTLSDLLCPPAQLTKQLWQQPVDNYAQSRYLHDTACVIKSSVFYHPFNLWIFFSTTATLRAF